MSEIPEFDPARGFVAFPVALFDLELSPGAFRTLAELCRMANAQGQCWPSLAQLGERLGRSRASVSAYIAELRGAGVLETEEQKMANGYNYRLRYTVTFWQEWRAGLGGGTAQRDSVAVQKAERRVQPVERPLRTKNHNHIKQTVLPVLNDLVSDWKAAVGRAPYPEFAEWPSEKTLQSTTTTLSAHLPSSAVISADIDEALRSFLESRDIKATEDLGSGLVHLINTDEKLSTLMDAVAAQWQPHWRNPPNLFQLVRMAETLPPAQSGAAEHKLLKSYMRRWELHLRSLPSGVISSRVAA